MLLLTTPYGNKYVVHDNGDIERLDIAGFRPSRQWKMRGLRHVKRNEFIPLHAINSALLDTLSLRWQNGNPQWTVADIDHGTFRTWSNTKFHGVKSIRLIDADILNRARYNRDSAIA